MLPWLPWVGDWALAWTEGREWLQIAFAMFIFPLAMNMVQYWIIDSFIMEKRTGEKDGGGTYERVQGEYDDDGEDGEGSVIVEHEAAGVDGVVAVKEAHSTAVDVDGGEGSRGVSPQGPGGRGVK